MAVPPLLRTLTHLHLHLHLQRHTLSPVRRTFFSFTFSTKKDPTPPTHPEEDPSSPTTPHSLENQSPSSSETITKVKETPKSFDQLNNANKVNVCSSSSSWEDEIISDIEPIVRVVKDVLHSSRYMNGDILTPDDEKAIVEQLLAYHPCSEDKIGCGLDSIMVDRHPRFPRRCLFVVRTDGTRDDFSYQKCLREYVRKKFPSHAEKFAREKLAVRYKQQQRFRLWRVGRMLQTDV